MRIIADSHIPCIQDYFGSYGELILKPGRTISSEDVKEADILLVRSITPVDEKLLANSNVKFVGSVTAGADHLDTHWLDQAGIAWSVANGFNAPPVADYVISVIAALQQQQFLSAKKIKAAVIGVGNIGKRVVELLRALNFDVTLCDPLRAAAETNFISSPLEELNDFDLITLHVPLTKKGDYPTYHFINKHFLQQQRPGCVLLNASRGAVINTNDLLEYGDHLEWCLDVWEHEPNINKEVLQVATIATPHIAGYSVQSKIRGIDMIYRIACEKKMIQPQSILPTTMPEFVIEVANEIQDWRDVVLAVFNPLMMTEQMQDLLDEENIATQFDAMRTHFNDRHEFGFVRVVGEGGSGVRGILEKLGFLTVIS